MNNVGTTDTSDSCFGGTWQSGHIVSRPLKYTKINHLVYGDHLGTVQSSDFILQYVETIHTLLIDRSEDNICIQLRSDHSRIGRLATFSSP